MNQASQRSGGSRGLNEAVAHLVHGSRTSNGLKRLHQIVGAFSSPSHVGLRLVNADRLLSDRVLAWLSAGVLAEGWSGEPSASAALSGSGQDLFFATACATQLATLAYIPSGCGVRDVDWLKHAVVCSRLAFWLGRKSGNDAFRAAVASGVQNVGILGIAAFDPKLYPSTVAGLYAGSGLPEIEAERLGFTHCEVGALALTQTGFPTWLVEAVRHHHDPTEPTDPVSKAMVVADHVACQMGYSLGLGQMPRAIPAGLAKALGVSTMEAMVAETMAAESATSTLIAP